MPLVQPMSQKMQTVVMAVIVLDIPSGMHGDGG